MRGSQTVIVAAVAIVVMIGLGISIIPPFLPSSDFEYLPSFNGHFYVSEIQNDNNNISYSVVFHDVNFTFLYWYWPWCWVEDNYTICAGEQPVSVFVLLTFQDNSTETLEIVIDSPGSCLIGIDSALRGVTTNHSNPKAGLATAETQELHSNWVFIVSIS